jgi:hypothetical protein
MNRFKERKDDLVSALIHHTQIHHTLIHHTLTHHTMIHHTLICHTHTLLTPCPHTIQYAPYADTTYTPYTIHPIHHTPYTIHPIHHTLIHHTPYTIHHTPYTPDEHPHHWRAESTFQVPIGQNVQSLHQLVDGDDSQGQYSQGQHTLRRSFATG